MVACFYYLYYTLAYRAKIKQFTKTKIMTLIPYLAKFKNQILPSLTIFLIFSLLFSVVSTVFISKTLSKSHVANAASGVDVPWLDQTFTTNIGAGFSDSVSGTIVQSDGKIVVYGDFVTFKGSPAGHLIRLNADGTIDTAFKTNLRLGFNGSVVTNAKIQSDGKIVVVGGFDKVINNINACHIARLNSDGTLDTTFNSNVACPNGFNNSVNTLDIQSDGKILVTGSFNSFSGTTVNGVARLNTDGTLDTAYTSNITAGVGTNQYFDATVLQSDGKLVLVGNFNTFDGLSVVGVIRLNTDGTLDTAFSNSTGTNFDGEVHGITFQPDGKLLATGGFTHFNGGNANNIARLNADGTADTAFNTNALNLAHVQLNLTVVQSDGKIIVGGFSDNSATPTFNRFGRINSDGTLDTTFAFNVGAAFDQYVNTVTILPNGNILVGGYFGTYKGTWVGKLAMIGNTTSGTTNTTLNLKVILSGPYDSIRLRMNTTLNNLRIIPASQPYRNAPFNYLGAESIGGGSFNSNVVDWVLIEVRDSANTTVVDRRAALLLNDGRVVDLINQTTSLILTTLSTGTQYNFIVRHRNHLAVATATPLLVATSNSNISIDFTTTPGVLNANQKNVAAGIYGMKPGNANGDSTLDSSDRVATRNANESSKIYVQSDLNMDGNINARDRQVSRLVGDSNGI